MSLDVPLTKKIKSLVGNVAKLHECDSDSPLHLAAARDAVESCKMMLSCLKRTDDVNVKNSLGMTPLHIAAENGHIKIVKPLLDYKLDVNAADSSGNKPLHFTALSRDDSLAGIIYESVNIDFWNKPLGLIPSRLKDLPYMKEWENISHEKLKVKIQIAEILLEKGASVDARNKLGVSPLHAAVHKENEELVEVLIDKYDADVNAVTNDGTTPLHFSVFNTQTSITEMLLRKKANIHATKRDKGATALHCACQAGSVEIVLILLRHGADLEARTKDGRTPLHYATSQGCADVVHLLLHYGADVEAKCQTGETALHIACERRCTVEVMKVLLYYGADVNTQMKIGSTPLYCICSKHEFINIDHLNSILECDPDINITSYNGLTPFESIKNRNEFGVTNFIKDHIVKMRLTKRYVDRKNVLGKKDIELMDFATKNKPNLFETKCRNEVEKMKESTIVGKISFYDLLTKEPNDVTIYSKNDAILSVMNSREYMTMFPIFRNTLYYRFKSAQKRGRLLEPSLDSLNRLIGYEFPLVARMEITRYLNNAELRNVIEAYPNRECN